MATVLRKKTKGATKKVCTCCGNELNIQRFYASKSPLASIDGKVSICKSCCDDLVIDDLGAVDHEKLKALLRQLDKPYFKDIWKSSEDQYAKEHPYVLPAELKYHGTEIFHLYMKNINSFRFLSDKGYGYSERNGFYNNIQNLVLDERDNLGLPQPDTNVDVETIQAKVKAANEDEDFEITDEIVRLFGEGYSKHEYKKMKNKYDKLKLNYIIQTSLHQEALATYVRFKVKEEDATAKGKVDEARKWYDAALNAADKAKLTPKQLTEADLQKGLNSFSEISQALEQAVDIVEILPRYKNSPADSVDFTIWCYINYARKLKGLPTVEYGDIYKFYDEMKQDYINQYGDPYGIFTEDTTVANRENVQKFITLPKDYAPVEEEEEGDDE